MKPGTYMVRVCPHCGNSFYQKEEYDGFDRHVQNCNGKTPPGPSKRKDYPAKDKDKRGHK